MTILQIEDVKSFMKYLLMEDKFDTFELIKGSITTYNTVDIDGLIQKDFYGSEYDSSDLYGYDYTPWSKAKELAFQLIKGKRTPLSFKFVLRAGNTLLTQVLTNLPEESTQHISSLILNIKFDSQGLSIVTGTSQTSFSLDKSADEVWDKWATKFIQGMQ